MLFPSNKSFHSLWLNTFMYLEILTFSGTKLHVFAPCIFKQFRLLSKLPYRTSSSHVWRIPRQCKPCTFLLLNSLNELGTHPCQHWYRYTKIHVVYTLMLDNDINLFAIIKGSAWALKGRARYNAYQFLLHKDDISQICLIRASTHIIIINIRKNEGMV